MTRDERNAEAAAILYQFLGALEEVSDTDEGRRFLLDHYTAKARAWGDNLPTSQPEEVNEGDVPELMWLAAQDRALKEGSTVSAVILRAIQRGILTDPDPDVPQ